MGKNSESVDTNSTAEMSSEETHAETNGVTNIQEKYNKQWSGREDTTHPVPKDVPSITELKKILPRHCFEPSLQESFYYVVKDLSYVFALYIAMRLIEMQPYSTILYISWPIYWLLQGTMFWALFVLAHDCGHGSFSKYDIINDITGTILNTLIFVPFYPWKLSHKHHHKGTGNIDKDEIFYPVRKGQRSTYALPDAPLFGLGAAWWGYLIIGFSPRYVHHLNPLEPLFKGHVFGCFCSLAALGAWSVLLSQYYTAFGLKALVFHYVIPVFVFGTWLVMVTFLHHTEVKVPWYGDKKWDNVRGQLSSVDRHYGWAHHLTHNIGTHQIHHLFIKIPHHLEEATAAFRKNYPHLVRICDKRIIPSFVRMFLLYEKQRLIEDDTEVHWFTDK